MLSRLTCYSPRIKGMSNLYPIVGAINREFDKNKKESLIQSYSINQFLPQHVQFFKSFPKEEPPFKLLPLTPPVTFLPTLAKPLLITRPIKEPE